MLVSIFDAVFDVLADGGSMSIVFVSTSWSSWPCSRVARYLYLASQKTHDPSTHHTYVSQLLLTVGMCRPSLMFGILSRGSSSRIVDGGKVRERWEDQIKTIRNTNQSSLGHGKNHGSRFEKLLQWREAKAF